MNDHCFPLAGTYLLYGGSMCPVRIFSVIHLGDSKQNRCLLTTMVCVARCRQPACMLNMARWLPRCSCCQCRSCSSNAVTHPADGDFLHTVRLQQHRHAGSATRKGGAAGGEGWMSLRLLIYSPTWHFNVTQQCTLLRYSISTQTNQYLV